MVTTTEFVKKPIRLVLIALLVALTALLTGTYGYYLSAIDNISDRVYHQLSAVAWTRTNLIETWRKERMADVWTLATEPLISKQLVNLAEGRADQVDKTNILESLEVAIKAYSYSEGLILNRESQPLISTGSDPVPLNAVEENAIQESLGTGLPKLSDLYRNSEGKVFMAAVAPFSNSRSEPSGVVLLRIDAQEKLYPMMESWPTPNDTVESALCRRDGDEVVVLTNVRRKEGTGMSLRMSMSQTHLPVVQAVSGNVGMYQGYDIRGVDVLADLRSIPGSRWFMVTKTDMPDIIAEARSRSATIALLGVLSLIILGGALAYVSRRRESHLYQELYQSEKLQREAEEGFRTTLYSIGDAVITTDRGGFIKQMNPVAQRLTGWPEQEAVGKLLEDVFHVINEVSREPVDTPAERVMRTGKLVGLANHTLLICRDGSERPIADSAAPITEMDGSVSGVVLVFRDQTDERAALQRLRDNQQRLTIIADHIYDWEYWLDDDNRMEFCSPSCKRLTGYSPEEFIDYPQLVRDIIHPDDIELYDRHVSQATSVPGVYECDYRIIARDGKIVWLSHCCTPVNDSDGKPMGRRISNRDVTERKLMEENRKKSLERQIGLNQLQQSLLGQGALLPKLKMITDTIVDLFDADFCRIWRIIPGDLCENGCMHAEVTDGPHVCLDRNKCLKLEASSGRYTHTDGIKHRRVPFGAYKIGRVASGEDHRFLTNDAVNDPRIHDHQWAKELGLVSFAGYKISLSDGDRLGVMALFSKHPISSEEDAQLDTLSNTVARLIYSAMIEKNLHESEERFRTAFMTSPDAITLSRLSGADQGYYVGVNEGFYDLTGYKPDEVIGKSTLDIGLWFDSKARDRLMAGLQEKGVVMNLESRMRLKDGRIKTALISARVISLSGAPHVLAITRDVDDWKKAEQSMRKSEERFRQVADLAGEWIWEVDEKGLYRYCSSAVRDILGYSPEEIVDKRFFWEFLISKEYDDRDSKPLEVFENKQMFKGYTSPHIHKDGRTVIIETSGAPILDDEGRFVGYRGTNTDITERVKASESLELLAAVVEHASESIVVTDLSGTIKYVNPAFEHTCGYSEQEAVGSSPRILKSGKQPDQFYADLWNTIRKGEIWRGHFINRKKDGSLFEEEATISPLKDTNGQIANFVAVKRDVTKEVLLQNQLVQSHKMEAIGTLAGGIAHHFNNILFAIVGYTEMAIDDQPPGSRSLNDLEQVLSAAKRAADMVKQILTFSRQTEPQRILLDLTPIVKEGLKFLRGSIPSTIEIRQEIKSLTGKVEADPTQMHQVLMNLCSNAAQAMKETTGVMTVELAEITLDEPYSPRHLSLKPGRYVKLSVSDTGYGIPPENIDRIFEPYFTTKGIGEGTGLGLAVIHGIVSGHGGAVTVYSIPGQGSTFNVFLPVAQRHVECEGASDSSPIPPGKERILFVDDEAILLEMGKTILERLGYRVVTFLDPLKALEAFRTDPGGFDLVLTDLMMPKMTGLVLARKIKIINPDIPIIRCTGFGHKFTTEEAQEHGLSGILGKPMSKKDMALTIRGILDIKQKQQPTS